MSLWLNTSQPVEPALWFALDNETTSICIYVLYSALCQMINVFGIVTNIINIICFVKQGFKDPINVSLLGLSISDLCSLLTMVWNCIGFTPAFIAADLPFESLYVIYLVSAMPHFAFIRVSSCITATISLERCLSVMAPLKVKQIINPCRVGVTTACIFVISTFSATPVYVVNRLGRQFSSLKNKTIVGLLFRNDKEHVEKVTIAIHNFFIPLCAFVIVAISTVVLSAYLRKNTEWRNRTITDVNADKISSRNLKVSKMVVTMASLFIFCFFPVTVIMLAVAFEPGLSLNGKYFNPSVVISGFIYLLESINSSVNIFIYHHMSTKYRKMFRKLFTGHTRKEITSERMMVVIMPHVYSHVS